VDRLIKINEKAFEEDIFKTFFNIVKNEKTCTVKSVLLANSAYLISLNRPKALKIFVAILKANPKLIKDAIWSAEYFAYKDFDKIKFFFEMGLKNKALLKDVGFLLAKLYISNVKGSENYLFELIKRNNEAKAEAVRVATHNKNIITKNKLLNNECAKIFTSSLNTQNDSVVHQFSVCFLHFDEEMFEALFPLLLLYSKSKVFLNSPAYFCKYILKCCNLSNVEKCFKLISQFSKLIPTDVTKGNYYDSEPLNLVLAIYNTLNDNVEAEVNLKSKCLDLFDAMLQQPHHRNAAYKALQLADV
jgi:hypothetical protein